MVASGYTGMISALKGFNVGFMKYLIVHDSGGSYNIVYIYITLTVCDPAWENQAYKIWLIFRL